MKPLFQKCCAVFVGMGIALGASTSASAAGVSMETSGAASVGGVIPQALAPLWSKAGVDIELALAQTLTKSLLQLGDATLDTAVIPPPAFGALAKGAGPYAKLGAEKGREMASHVRTLFAFPGSTYHVIVWANSGIDGWSQVKGKRVYIGPPAGAANGQIRGSVKTASGWVGGQNYDEIKAPWGAAAQGFKDGQFDVLYLPVAKGSQAVTEMSLARPIRLLPMPVDASPAKGSGLANTVIVKGTYKGQVNGDQDVPAWQTVMNMATRQDLPEDVAYKLTKTYIENRAYLAKSNALLSELTAFDPLQGLVAPLHPGAARYYQEQGLTIPADLMPR